MSNFLWADKTDDHRKHWISWKQISSPKTEGGLDVRTFKMKMGWKLLHSKSLWTQF